VRTDALTYIYKGFEDAQRDEEENLFSISTPPSERYHIRINPSQSLFLSHIPRSLFSKEIEAYQPLTLDY